VLWTQLVLPGMVRRRNGRIVNITSQAGVFRWPNVSAYSVSKAAVVELTENLAWEARRHGISVFSVHPGLLPNGLTETALSSAAAGSPAEAAISEWTRGERAAGRGTEPARAVELIVRLLLGPYAALSGRHLSVHDDVDELLERIDAIRVGPDAAAGRHRARRLTVIDAAIWAGFVPGRLLGGNRRDTRDNFRPDLRTDGRSTDAQGSRFV
jgi:hypothetical protein